MFLSFGYIMNLLYKYYLYPSLYWPILDPFSYKYIHFNRKNIGEKFKRYNSLCASTVHLNLFIFFICWQVVKLNNSNIVYRISSKSHFFSYIPPYNFTVHCTWKGIKAYRLQRRMSFSEFVPLTIFVSSHFYFHDSVDEITSAFVSLSSILNSLDLL